MSTILCSPEKFDCELVAEVDTDEVYSFNTVIVLRWAHDGKLYAAHDSGCSCPTPFESHHFPSDFVQISRVEDLHPLLEQQSEYYRPSPVAVLDFIQKVGREL